MKKAEIKSKAREELLIATQVAFHAISDNVSGSYIEDDQERAAVLEQMDKDFRRIEKMFDYEPGSWTRGC